MMAKRYRAYFQGEADAGIPPESYGFAWRAGGHFDPQSAEYGAWLFAPEGDADSRAYYVNREALFLTNDPAPPEHWAGWGQRS